MIALVVVCVLLLDWPGPVWTVSNLNTTGKKPPPNTMAARMRDYAEEDAGKRADPDRWRGSVLSGRERISVRRESARRWNLLLLS